ncbi:MAG TPA: hypothetical protein VLJ60_11210, partial [bacterium]|nr:hypothetical protein [bacterium]
AVRLGHDLNEDPDFNIADIRAGISGDYRLNNSFRLVYQTYYKRLESRIVNENDRVVVNARMRANVVPRFDLFFDGYLEYSFNDGRTFFVNRNVSLSGRLWFLEKKLNISSGLTVIFDHHTIYLDDGPQKEKLFVPLWPFLMSELYLFKSESLLKNFRGFAKFVIKVGEFGRYSNRSFMFNGGFISQIGYTEPYVSFRWNSSGAQTLKTMGIDLGMSVRF